MKRFLSYRDFEENLKNTPLPSIDMRDDVMSHISGMGKGRLHKKSLLVFLIIMISTFITAFAALREVNIWQLFNKNGSPVYTYETLPRDRAQDIRANSYDISSYERILKPGEAAAIIFIKDSINEVQFVQQPEYFYNLSDLEKKADIRGIAKIPEGFSFESGEVEYKIDHSVYEEINKAAVEARKKGEKIIKLDIKKLDEYESASLIYRKGSISLKEEIFNDPDKELAFSSYDDEKVEKLKIHNKEALYISGNGEQRIIWVDEMNGGIKTKLTVYSSPDISKEELINAAEKIIRK